MRSLCMVTLSQNLIILRLLSSFCWTNRKGNMSLSCKIVSVLIIALNSFELFHHYMLLHVPFDTVRWDKIPHWMSNEGNLFTTTVETGKNFSNELKLSYIRLLKLITYLLLKLIGTPLRDDMNKVWKDDKNTFPYLNIDLSNQCESEYIHEMMTCR